MSLNLASDWKVIDDLEPVTLYSKTGEGSYAAPLTVPNAYWEELNFLDYQMRPDLLQQAARAVHLWTAKLSGTVPKLSDKVVDQSSVSWYVTRVEYLDLDSNGVERYRLTCFMGT